MFDIMDKEGRRKYKYDYNTCFATFFTVSSEGRSGYIKIYSSNPQYPKFQVSNETCVSNNYKIKISDKKYNIQAMYCKCSTSYCNVVLPNVVNKSD